MTDAQNQNQKSFALVSGASSGIGLALAKCLAQDGVDLMLVARRADVLAQVADDLRQKYPVTVHVVAADLNAVGAIDTVMADIAKLGRSVDVLINNAGAGVVGDFAEMSPDDIARVTTLNITAFSLLARAVLPQMKHKGRGRMLNIASTAAFQPGPGMAVYFASKAYVLSLSQALSAELQGTGITVTALCPGPTVSEFGARSGIEGTNVFKGAFPVARAEDVAAFGYKAMIQGKRVAVHGLLNRLSTWSAQLAPMSVVLWMTRNLLKRAP